MSAWEPAVHPPAHFLGGSSVKANPAGGSVSCWFRCRFGSWCSWSAEACTKLKLVTAPCIGARDTPGLGELWAHTIIDHRLSAIGLGTCLGLPIEVTAPGLMPDPLPDQTNWYGARSSSCGLVCAGRRSGCLIDRILRWPRCVIYGVMVAQGLASLSVAWQLGSLVVSSGGARRVLFKTGGPLRQHYLLDTGLRADRWLACCSHDGSELRAVIVTRPDLRRAHGLRCYGGVSGVHSGMSRAGGCKAGSWPLLRPWSPWRIIFFPSRGRGLADLLQARSLSTCFGRKAPGSSAQVGRWCRPRREVWQRGACAPLCVAPALARAAVNATNIFKGD